ncbi:MAG: purine-nucleoside phosphorylase, partial [Actinobacteria bacterium]|nr:purine-nucleoside phosphorylase [Actinomycetota bacterium]
MTTAFDLAAEAAEFLRKRFGGNHDIVAVLGSGWADAVGVLGTGDRCAIGEVPGFKKPSALGHGGEAISVSVGSSRVLVLTGRTHLYEGHGTAPVVHGVRTAAALGCRVAVLTNGAGVLREDWTIGEPVMISDHINLTGHSPMTGDNPPAPFAGRFVDLTDAYSKRLRAIARGASPMNEGVYLGLHGPHYETPAEIRAGRSWGADLVGMSTVLEVIAARHVGLEVLALSLPTNLAAG